MLFHRYVQCADLSSGSAFELPQYQTAPNKSDYTALGTQRLPDSRNDTLGILTHTPYLTEACQGRDPESHYLEIPNAQKVDNPQNKFVISDFLPLSPTCDAKVPSLSMMRSPQEEQLTIPMEDTTLHLSNDQLEHQGDVPYVDSTDEKYTQIENKKDASTLNENGYNEHKQGTHSSTENDTVPTYQRIENLSNFTDKLIMPLFETCKEHSMESLDTSHEDDTSHSTSLMHPSPSNSHSQFTEQRITTELKNDSSLFSHHGIVVGIDNSNIYIGAQECASMVNPGDRKRHVRLKLQNLVRILERERTKMRGFACGSSPPATEHVWEVYR